MRVLEQAVRIRSFLVGSAAVTAVTYLLASTGRSRASNLVLCLEPILLVLWTVGLHLYRRELIARFDTLEQRPAAAPNDIPDSLSITREELGSLGFKRVAAIESRYPWQRWRPAWVSRDRHATTIAVVVDGPGVLLTTYWPDGAVVTATNRPPRIGIDLPSVRQFGLRGEAAGLYLRHRDLCAEFRQQHGEPRTVETLEQFVEAERLSRPNLRRAFAAWTARPRTLVTEVAVGSLAVILLIAQALTILGEK